MRLAGLAGSGISRKRPRLKRPMVATPPPFAPTIERTPFRSSETPVLPPWLSYHRLHDGRLERGKVTPRLLTSSTCDPSGATLHFQVNESMVAIRLVSAPSHSNTKFAGSQAFCLAPSTGDPS